MSIRIDLSNLREKHGIENVKAALSLRKTGLFTDEQIQKYYDEQIELDKKEEEKEKK